MTAKKRKKPRLGEIYAIPLPNGSFGFARFYLQSKVGVFDLIATQIPSSGEIMRHQVVFWVRCHEDPTRTVQWPYVGRVPFKSIDEAWPPAIYIRDLTDPRCCTVYIRNQSWSVLPEDIKDLEPVQLWSVKMIVDRINHQLIDRKPWDIKAHCLYHQDLAKKYGPDYEQVIADTFRNVPWRKSRPLPGTMIDSISLETYLEQSDGTGISIDFLTENALRQMDEIEDAIHESLSRDDLGGVVGSGHLVAPNAGDSKGDLQLEVYHLSKAFKLVKKILKDKGLTKETIVSSKKD